MVDVVTAVIIDVAVMVNDDDDKGDDENDDVYNGI